MGVPPVLARDFVCCRISGSVVADEDARQNMKNPNEEVDPKVAQIYEEERTGARYQILYIDDQVVTLRCEQEGRRGKGTHRLEQRGYFVKAIESGQFKHRPDSNLDMMGLESEDWSDIDYIGAKTDEALHEAGFDTVLDVQQGEESDLLAVDGLGKKGLANLDAYCH
jgi:hypothetical protein